MNSRSSWVVFALGGRPSAMAEEPLAFYVLSDTVLISLLATTPLTAVAGDSALEPESGVLGSP